MAENTTQAKHLTSLDFDIDKIPNQLESISKMVDSYAEQIQESFNKKVQFNPFSGVDESGGANTLENVRKNVKKMSDQIKESFADITDEQGIISSIFSKEEIDDAKERLLSLLSVYGRIGSVKIDTDANSEALRATVTTIDDYGRKITEVFTTQRKEITNAAGEVVEYQNTWQKVSSSITENLEQQRKAEERAAEQQRKILEQQAKQRDDFYKRNMTGPDFFFKQREEEAKAFSASLKAQMEEEAELENQREQFYKKNLTEIDYLIQKRQEEAKAFSASLKAQMEAEVQLENQQKKRIEYMDKLIERQKDMTTKYSTKLGDDSELAKQSRELTDQLETMRDQVKVNKQLNEGQEDRTDELVKQSRELDRQYKSLQNQPKVQNSFLSTIDAAKFTVVQEGLDLIQEGVVNTFQTLKSVEDQVVEITRVFSDANVNMEQFTDDMFTLATSYGRTFEDAGEVVLRFAQAGYDISDSLEMAESTMLALNTAELDVENSTNSLISIMRQWKMETEEFPLLIDKINYAADNYATTSQDLVDGLLRVSSAAKNAGITFDENIGLLTAMQETSGRTGKEIGTALNSLITFTQKAQTDGTLEGMGISVFADAAQTELRSVMDIWDDLSEKVKSGGTDFVDSLMKQLDMTDLMSEQVAEYAGLTEELAQIQELEHQMNEQNISDMEKQEIYELGKTYRRNYFIALLENFNSVQEIANDLQNAEGHSMQENSKYMDTLTAKYNQFIGSLRELAQQAGEAGLMDLAKGVLDLATNFNYFLKSVGGARTVLTMLLGIILQIKQADIASGMGKIGTSLGKSLTGLKDFATAMMNAEGATGKLAVAGTALSKVNWVGWVGIATTAYAALDSAIRSAQGAAEEERQEIISAGKAAQENASRIEDLKTQYDSLAVVQGRTEEQDQELLDVSEELEEVLGDRALALKKLKVDSEDYNKVLEEQIELSKEANKTALADATRAAGQSLEASTQKEGILGIFGGKTIGNELIDTDNLVDAQGKLTKVGEIIQAVFGDLNNVYTLSGEVNESFKSLQPDDWSAEGLLDYYNMVYEVKNGLDELGDSMTESERDALVASDAYRSFADELARMDKEASVAEYAAAKLREAFAEFNGELPETREEFAGFIDSMIESTGVGDAFRDVAEEMAKEAFPELADVLKESALATDEFAEAARRASEAQKQMAEHQQNLNDLTSAYNTLAGTVSEYNATGQLSIDTLGKLIALEPQYLQYLINENGQLVLNHDAFINLANAELTEMEIAQKRTLLNTIQSFQSEAEAQAWLAVQTRDTTDALAEMNAELANTIASLATTKGWSDETVQSLANMANAISTMYDATRDSLKETFTYIPKYTASAVKTSANTAKAATKSFYEQETEMFERLNRMGQKTTQEVVDFYREMTKSSKVSASERLKAEEKLFDAIKRQLQEAKEAQLDYYDDLKDKIEANADAEIDRLESQRDSIEASYDSQRKALEDQKEAIEDAADAQLDALDRVEKAKDRARERDEYYRDREDILQDIDSASRRSGIDARRDEAEARERLEELDREYQEKLEDYEIEDQREAIEANKEAQLAAIEEQMDALEEWRDSSIEDIEASIDAVEAQKEAQLAAIDEQIAALNEAFSEEQINMLAYQAMTNEELYNQYYDQFIEPMSQGMYDGFVAASDAMTDAAASSASNMLAAYEANLIAPLSNELASVGSMLDSYMNQMNEMANFIGPPTYEQWLAANGGAGNVSSYDNRSVNIRNYNTISDALSGKLTENRIVKSITDKFYAR